MPPIMSTQCLAEAALDFYSEMEGVVVPRRKRSSRFDVDAAGASHADLSEGSLSGDAGEAGRNEAAVVRSPTGSNDAAVAPPSHPPDVVSPLPATTATQSIRRLVIGEGKRVAVADPSRRRCGGDADSPRRPPEPKLMSDALKGARPDVSHLPPKKYRNVDALTGRPMETGETSAPAPQPVLDHGDRPNVAPQPVLDHGDPSRVQFPDVVLAKLRSLGASDPEFICSKILTGSDVDGNQNRLLFSSRAFRDHPIAHFLTEEEVPFVLDKNDGLSVATVDVLGESYALKCKYLESNQAYRLIGGWRCFVERHGLKEVVRSGVREVEVELFKFRSPEPHRQLKQDCGALGLVLLHCEKERRRDPAEAGPARKKKKKVGVADVTPSRAAATALHAEVARPQRKKKGPTDAAVSSDKARAVDTELAEVAPSPKETEATEMAAASGEARAAAAALADVARSQKKRKGATDVAASSHAVRAEATALAVAAPARKKKKEAAAIAVSSGAARAVDEEEPRVAAVAERILEGEELRQAEEEAAMGLLLLKYGKVLRNVCM